MHEKQWGYRVLFCPGFTYLEIRLFIDCSSWILTSVRPLAFIHLKHLPNRKNLNIAVNYCTWSYRWQKWYLNWPRKSDYWMKTNITISFFWYQYQFLTANFKLTKSLLCEIFQLLKLKDDRGIRNMIYKLWIAHFVLESL